MTLDGGPLSAIAEIADPDLIRIQLFANGASVHAPLAALLAYATAIAERGSNANGSYVRFVDGQQLCWQHFNDLPATWGTPSGQLFTRSSAITWTFPAAFISTAELAVLGSVWRVGTAVGVGTAWSSNTQALVLPWSAVTLSAAASKVFDVVAIGRWF